MYLLLESIGDPQRNHYCVAMPKSFFIQVTHMQTYFNFGVHSYDKRKVSKYLEFECFQGGCEDFEAASGNSEDHEVLSAFVLMCAPERNGKSHHFCTLHQATSSSVQAS